MDSACNCTNGAVAMSNHTVEFKGAILRESIKVIRWHNWYTIIQATRIKRKFWFGDKVVYSEILLPLGDVQKLIKILQSIGNPE